MALFLRPAKNKWTNALIATNKHVTLRNRWIWERIYAKRRIYTSAQTH